MPDGVSIIIPTYNSRRFIEETITSCLNQTHKNVEIIIIDDGSTDGTRELLLSYRDIIKIIFNEKNLGIVKSVNKGVNSTSSDFFILLGHDDLLPENHIEFMLTEFSNDIVGIHCNSMKIDSDGAEKGFSRNNLAQSEKTKNCLFELSLDNFISSCGMMQRTSVFKKIGGWDESYLHYGEWLYYVKSLTYGRIKYTTKTYAYYRRHSNNITNSFRDKSVLKGLNQYKNTCRKLAYVKSQASAVNSFSFFKKIAFENAKTLIQLWRPSSR